MFYPTSFKNGRVAVVQMDDPCGSAPVYFDGFGEVESVDYGFLRFDAAAQYCAAKYGVQSDHLTILHWPCA